MTTLWTVAWMCKLNSDSGQLKPRHKTRESAERSARSLNKAIDTDVHWAVPVIQEVNNDSSAF